MIGALLSNTPANLLRSSGVAGEVAPRSGEVDPGRDPSAARDSQASPRAAAISVQNAPTLTSQAILALQDVESADVSAKRPSQSGPLQAEPDDAEISSADRAQDGDHPTSKPIAEADRGQAPANSANAENSDEKEDPDGDGLNEAEEKQVQELKQRDREVRAHEQAHARVGGAYASAPSYTFQQGPDGKRYAVGGEVQIDTAKERTPEATIRKMRVVISAALAPAEPSGQDLSVAQQARSQLSEAQAELRQQKLEELKGDEGEADAAENVDSTKENPIASATSSTAPEDDKPNGTLDRTAQSEEGAASNSRRQRADNAELDAYKSAIERATAQQSSINSLFA
ncbi:putative metalloprotease CJM1_0395 family protein [Roseibium sp.]|uniref:putative metalloprotease CJM1_0395 family protein n=1 Tax=Roseibium sp. TaxID=1936156 RepID=UPI003B52BCC6